MKIFSKKAEFPLVPLKDLVVFPEMIIPFFVGRKKSIQAVENANKQGRLLFVAAQKDTSIEEPEENDIYHTGTIVHILQMLKLPDGTVRLLVEGNQRAKIIKYLQKDKFLKVGMDYYLSKPLDIEELEKIMGEI